MSATHYRTLGIAPGADEGTIRRAYLALVRQHHPDHAGGSASQLQAVNAAYEVLRDPVRRAEYDRCMGSLLRADFNREPTKRRIRGRLLGPLLVLVLAAGTVWLAKQVAPAPEAAAPANAFGSARPVADPEVPPLRPPPAGTIEQSN